MNVRIYSSEKKVLNKYPNIFALKKSTYIWTNEYICQYIFKYPDIRYTLFCSINIESLSFISYYHVWSMFVCCTSIDYSLLQLLLAFIPYYYQLYSLLLLSIFLCYYLLLFSTIISYYILLLLAIILYYYQRLLSSIILPSVYQNPSTSLSIIYYS